MSGAAFARFALISRPPAKPPVSLDPDTRDRLRGAEQKLVRLDLAGEMVPSIEWFIHAFVRKEAVVS